MTSSRLAPILFAAFCAQAAELKLFEAVEPHMGTLVRIKLYAPDADRAAAGFRAAFARIADLDSALSDYRPDSELNRLCRTEVGKPVAVSADLFRVLESSQSLAQETGGAFDVTIGPVVRLWREARREQRLPNATALEEAGRRCGFRKVHLDATRQTVMLDQSGMQLDLGGIAKGYAADAALASLANQGITRALVAVSGDLALGDPPPGRPGWKVEAAPAGPAFPRVLELAHAAVSTSGDAEQHLDAGGIRYSHIIDPATHQALASPIGVTVVARRGIEADGLATAFCVLGAQRGLQLVEEHRGAAALAATGRDPEIRFTESSGWRRNSR
ncbi:MAG TPA: FAD:protein FMN transferase [Bryobacteraceae bacterium]|jgi:thiamine biosynthesis lipoprotein